MLLIQTLRSVAENEELLLDYCELNEVDPCPEIVCAGCGFGMPEHNLVEWTVEGCGRFWHTYCVYPRLLDVPEGDWHCPCH